MSKFSMGSAKASTAIATKTVEVEEQEDTSIVPASDLPNIDGDALANHAAHLAAKAGKVLGDIVERLAKAREDWQGGPIYTLLGLKASYSDEELDEFAIPGSETGNNPDRFSITTVKGDKKGKKKTTFYAQFARHTPAGIAIEQRLEWLDRAADKGANKDGIPDDVLGMSPTERDSERSFLENRIRTMTAAYKAGMNLHFKLKEVNEYADNIVAAPIWADGQSPDDVKNEWEAKVVQTAEPIAVWVAEEGKPITKWEAFSIASFLRLDTGKALEKGGGFKALVESGVTKKAPAIPGQPSGDGINIKTVDTSLGALVELHRYILEIQSQKDGAEWGKLVQSLTKKGNDEYVSSIVELKNILVDTCRDNKLDQKYIAMKQAGSDLVSQ